MTQSTYIPSGRPSRTLGGASIPPSARPSAEHVRALAAATRLDVRLLKKEVQRPLMSVWVAEAADQRKVLLTVVDACGTPAERDRVMGGAGALLALADAEGVQRVERVAEDADAFVSEFHGAGTAADLVVLRWRTLRKLDFLCRVADGLARLHEAGILHGCLSPDNVLLDDDLQPVVTEASMVSIADSLEGDAENVFGYGAYAAPEVTTGELDARSDVFSMGKLLTFVMLDRTPGEMGDAADLAAKDPSVAAIARRCGGPAADRYPTMAELAAELARCRQLLPREGETMRPAGPELPRSPIRAPAVRTVAPPVSRGTQRPQPPSGAKWAAPRWVAAACSAAIVASVTLSQLAALRSEALHFVLVVSIILSMVGITTVIPAGRGVRLALAALGLATALALDPIGRISQLDSADVGARGAAGRVFVLKGGRDLGGMRLQGADLSSLDLSGARLDGADFTDAKFTASKLHSARVAGASFVMAHFEGADLSGVALDSAFATETATCDEATTLPEGWRCGPNNTLRKGAARP